MSRNKVQDPGFRIQDSGFRIRETALVSLKSGICHLELPLGGMGLAYAGARDAQAGAASPGPTKPSPPCTRERSQPRHSRANGNPPLPTRGAISCRRLKQFHLLRVPANRGILFIAQVAQQSCAGCPETEDRVLNHRLARPQGFKEVLQVVVTIVVFLWSHKALFAGRRTRRLRQVVLFPVFPRNIFCVAFAQEVIS